jgi:hypothetical protein
MERKKEEEKEKKRGSGKKGASEGSDYNKFSAIFFFSLNLFFFRAQIVTNAEFPAIGWLEISLAGF